MTWFILFFIGITIINFLNFLNILFFLVSILFTFSTLSFKVVYVWACVTNVRSGTDWWNEVQIVNLHKICKIIIKLGIFMGFLVVLCF